MVQRVSDDILVHLSAMPDHRVIGRCLHELGEVLYIGLCAVISGAEGWLDMYRFGIAKEAWLRERLVLKYGIPSADTFRRVFTSFAPEFLSIYISQWGKSQVGFRSGRQIAIDGKTVRGSYDKADGKSAIHMISAWASDYGIVLGQLKTEEKSNEITAVPELLQQIDIDGAIVSADAMSCQKDIAKIIVKNGGDYVLALKGNQASLHEEAAEIFDEVVGEDFEGIEQRHHRTIEEGHGRIEERDYWIVEELEHSDIQKEWPGLRCFGMVTSKRTVGEKTSTETRYYITSLPCKVKDFARIVRNHWAVENNLHWVLDVSFREDECRIRKGHGAENMSLLRRMALLALKRETTLKVGIKTKRKTAGWDIDYLERVMALF